MLPSLPVHTHACTAGSQLYCSKSTAVMTFFNFLAIFIFNRRRLLAWHGKTQKYLFVPGNTASQVAGRKHNTIIKFVCLTVLYPNRYIGTFYLYPLPGYSPTC